MRRSQATRYARWSALTALGIVVVVIAVYARKSWERSHALKIAPPALPVSITQRSATFAFSKMEGQHTLFTVRASRATEFKEGDKSLLEDVWITVYGHNGTRFDNLHTQQCDYLRDSGQVVCKGEVQIDLESQEEAKQPATQRGIRVVTSNLSFDRQTGEARSEQPVTFRFPYGQGSAVGVAYSSSAAAVHLLHDVQMTLNQQLVGHGAQPVTFSAAGLEYRREVRVLRLLGPVRAEQGPREITAGVIILELSPSLRATRLTAEEKPQINSRELQGQLTLAAEKLSCEFASDGSVEKMIALGNVHATRRPPGHRTGDDQFTSDSLELEFSPRNNQPRLLAATGSVRMDSTFAPITNTASGSTGGSRHLETADLRLYFASRARGGPAELARGETLAPGSAEFVSPLETTVLHGERLEAEYGPKNRLERLIGKQGVELERRLPGHQPQVTHSQDGTIEFGARGDWLEARQNGSVRFHEGERTAEADHARLVRDADTLTLTGSAAMGDAQSETTAPSIVLNQRTGDISADSGVRTTYRKPEPSGITNLGSQPAHITAQRLSAVRDKGQVLYSGGARLWQGGSVIEGDTIELHRDDRLLLARGNVSALFPQAEAPSVREHAGAAAVSRAATGASPPQSAVLRAGQPTIWRTHAGRLTYRSADSVVLLEERVHAESQVAQVDSSALQLFLGAGEGPAGGTRQLTRALATGGVTVRQEDRRGSADRAEYVVAEGKFVLSGGNPTLEDALEGTTTGRQLTFFLADDRILVESSEGTRTLTRHRIQQ